MKPRILLLAVLAALLAGCGGSSSATKFPTVEAARTYSLVDFKPAGPVIVGKPTVVSFVIRQPDGRPLTQYKTGPGPHTGVHLIMVRKDLDTIIHRHPPVDANGRASITVVFKEPGPYKVVVDAYPAAHGVIPNFQLFTTVHVAGAYHPQPLPPPTTTETVDGYRFTIHGGEPDLHAIQAGVLNVTVVDSRGRPAHFEPWYGALGHAIFFRKTTLDYFHTHICAKGAVGCTSILGGQTVTGTSATPGLLKVGVLVPIPGTWRLFLQCQVNHAVITAPFTLIVK